MLQWLDSGASFTFTMMVGMVARISTLSGGHVIAPRRSSGSEATVAKPATELREAAGRAVAEPATELQKQPAGR